MDQPEAQLTLGAEPVGIVELLTTGDVVVVDSFMWNLADSATEWTIGLAAGIWLTGYVCHLPPPHGKLPVAKYFEKPYITTGDAIRVEGLPTNIRHV